MKMSLKKTIDNLLNWSGLKYTWDIGTNNTTDTWIPVFSGRTIHHRVLHRPNFMAAQGQSTADITTNVTYNAGGKDIQSYTYNSKTGRFVVIASAIIKTSRYTSGFGIKIDGAWYRNAGTNLQTSATMVPVAVYDGTAGNHTVTIALSAQDSGTTATLFGYNSWNIIIFDLDK